METVIKPRAPFDFEATARFLRYTEAEAVDTFAGGRYRRAVHFGNELRLLEVEQRGTLSRPLLAVTLGQQAATAGGEAESAANEAAVDFVRRVFSAEHDLRKFRRKVAGDALMSKLEAAHRGLHVPRWPTLLEALVISILSQQISTAVAMTLKRRLVEKFGESLTTEAGTFYAFPRAASLAEADGTELRALGLSGAKAVAITDLARRVEAGELEEWEPGRLENEALISRLVALRGVGRWTAEWALMLHFGRTDVFPAGDLALRGFVVKYYNDGWAMTERQIRSLAQVRWGEWASYAAVYFLAGMRSGTISLKA